MNRFFGTWIDRAVSQAERERRLTIERDWYGFFRTLGRTVYVFAKAFVFLFVAAGAVALVVLLAQVVAALVR